ncbi:MAG: hypothetical protein A3A86_04350 [Elusimicrobia bacterium RIFCSPLOWO2_01_FULL_60_11]|nr:MAG: hypothetical protein A3A86_04350 [Elusimicrobia bacterium RIFCSPLOWO2_01_FULL_60_11]
MRSTDRLGGQSTVALTLESLRRIAVGGTNHFVKLLLVVYACALWSAFKDRDEAPPSGRLRLSALAYAAVILGFSMLQDGGFRYPDFQVYLPLFMAVLLLGVRSLRDQTPIKKPLLAALLSLCAAMTVWSGVIRWRQAPITQLCFTPDNPRLKGMYLRDEDHGFVQGLLEFEKSIPKTEGIFVFPDPLFFYFATERMSPVPAVPFLKFSWDLRPEERALIPRWLEDKKVEWAVIGQETSYDSGYLRFGREETWKEAVKKGLVMGTRGDYPDLERYLDRNFKEVTGPKGFWTLKRRR